MLKRFENDEHSRMVSDWDPYEQNDLQTKFTIIDDMPESWQISRSETSKPDA